MLKAMTHSLVLHGTFTGDAFQCFYITIFPVLKLAQDNLRDMIPTEALAYEILRLYHHSGVKYLPNPDR